MLRAGTPPASNCNLERRAIAPKRLIFVPFIHGFGGVERLVLSLSRFLTGAGQSHAVVCFEDTIGLPSFTANPLEVITIPASRSPLSEFAALRGNPVFRSESANPVLAFDIKGAFYSQLIPGSSVIHFTDPPSLLPTDVTRDAFSLSSDLLKSLKRPLHSARAELAHRLTRRGVRKAEKVIVMTNVIAREIRTLYGVQPIVIRPGVNLLSNNHAPRRVTALRLLSISRLESSKRIDWVFRALASLEGIEWHFDVIGDGSDRSALETRAHKLGIVDRVTFHGWVDDKDLEEIRSRSTLFVMPAAQGYGLPALESLAGRVPVIVHRDSGVSEILGGTPWVRIISEPDGSDIAPAIREMGVAISRGLLSDYPVPSIPSDMDWGREIASQCGWLQSNRE